MKASVADKILERLHGFAEALEKAEKLTDLTGKFTCRQVVLDLKPSSYTPQAVKEVRKMLGVSQGVFAQLLGVSPRTVQAWERGANEPTDMACRWLDEINRDPEYWLKRIRQAAVAKKSLKKDTAKT
jgi:putative transcriptional regulator